MQTTERSVKSILKKSTLEKLTKICILIKILMRVEEWNMSW